MKHKTKFYGFLLAVLTMLIFASEVFAAPMFHVTNAYSASWPVGANGPQLGKRYVWSGTARSDYVSFVTVSNTGMTSGIINGQINPYQTITNQVMGPLTIWTYDGGSSLTAVGFMTDDIILDLTIHGIYISAPTVSFSSATATSITWSWPAVTDAQGYRIYNSSGALLTTTTSTSYTMAATPGQNTSIKVGAYSYDYQATSGYVSGQSLPSTPTGLAATTSRVSWSNNANIPGKGAVNLTWGAATGAAGYRVYMFDGYQWRMVQDVGNVLAWNSHSALIYPSDAVLDTYGTNSQAVNLFKAVSTGEDLADRPTKLFSKTYGTTYDAVSYHYFLIRAYNSSGGETPNSNPVTPTLPDSTDTVAPTGSLIINSGAYNTSDRNVSLSISGSDSESGLYQMQFSSDNVSWTAWESFSTTKTYQVGTDGEQKVYLKIKDTAGNISNIVSSSIFFINDTVPPDIKLNINNGSSQTFTNLIDLEITGQDNLTAPENIKMRVSLDGTNWQIYNSASKTWSASTSWGSYAAVSENFNLGSTGGQKYIYVQLKDPSGNISNATGTVFYVTSAVTPATTTAAPVVNGTWGINLNGTYLSIDGSVMLVLQGNSVSLSLTGISNSSELLTSFNGVDWSPPDKIPTSTTTFTKNLSFSDQGKRAVFVKLRNEFGVDSSVLVRYYLIDYTPPTLEVKTVSGATLTSGGSMNLLVKAKDNVSTKLAYRINGSAWAVLLSNGVISSESLVVGRNQLNVEVIDESGNVAQEVINVWKK